MPTDIQHKRHLRVDGAGSQIMRHGLHHPVVQLISSLDQVLAIASSGAADDSDLLVMLLRLSFQTGQGFAEGFETVTLVAAII